MTDPHVELPEDLIRGAVAIGRFITPAEEARKLSDKQLARKVYHLAATSNLPVFRLGSRLCARKSVLLQWIESQEKRHAWQFEKPNQPLRLVAGQKS